LGIFILIFYARLQLDSNSLLLYKTILKSAFYTCS